MVKTSMALAIAALCAESSLALPGVGSEGLAGARLAPISNHRGAFEALRGGGAGSATPKKRTRAEGSSGGVSKTPRKETATPSRKSAPSVPMTPKSSKKSVPLHLDPIHGHPSTPRTPAPSKSSSSKSRAASPARSPSPSPVKKRLSRSTSTPTKSDSPIKRMQELKDKAVSYAASLSPVKTMQKLPSLPKLPKGSMPKMPSRAVLQRNALIAAGVALVVAVCNALLTYSSQIAQTLISVTNSIPGLTSKFGYAVTRPPLMLASLLASLAAKAWAGLVAMMAAVAAALGMSVGWVQSQLTFQGRAATGDAIAMSLNTAIDTARSATTAGGETIVYALSSAKELLSRRPTLPPAVEFARIFVDAAASVPRAITLIPLTLQDGMLSIMQGRSGVRPPRAQAGEAMIVAIGFASVYAFWNYYMWLKQQA